MDAREEPFAPARERAAKREEGAAAAAIVDEATTILVGCSSRDDSRRAGRQRKRRRTRERGAAAALERCVGREETARSMCTRERSARGGQRARGGGIGAEPSPSLTLGAVGAATNPNRLREIRGLMGTFSVDKSVTKTAEPRFYVRPTWPCGRTSTAQSAVPADPPPVERFGCLTPRSGLFGARSSPRAAMLGPRARRSRPSFSRRSPLGFRAVARRRRGRGGVHAARAQGRPDRRVPAERLLGRAPRGRVVRARRVALVRRPRAHTPRRMTPPRRSSGAALSPWAARASSTSRTSG